MLIVVRAQHDEPSSPAQEAAPVAVVPDRVQPAPLPAPATGEGDVTAELAAEPVRITATYAQTTRELLELAREARAQWGDERKREFDTELAALEKKVASTTDDRPRRAAYRSLIRFLQRAVIRDDVALADVGATP